MKTMAHADADGCLEGFDNFVLATIEAWKVPGLAIGIVKDDEVIFLEGFGLREIDRQLPVTPRTLFALASGATAFSTIGARPLGR